MVLICSHGPEIPGASPAADAEASAVERWSRESALGGPATARCPFLPVGATWRTLGKPRTQSQIGAPSTV